MNKKPIVDTITFEEFIDVLTNGRGEEIKEQLIAQSKKQGKNAKNKDSLH